MNLRTQMLLAGALTLAVPVIGWQSVKQLDESLRQTRVDQQALRVANARLALAESDNLQAVLAQSASVKKSHDIYAERARYPLFVDGYDDDWQELKTTAKTLVNSENQNNKNKSDSVIELKAAERDNKLYLFITISDNKVVYHVPPVLKLDLTEEESLQQTQSLANGDALMLLFNDGTTVQQVMLSTIAPGPMLGTAIQTEKYTEWSSTPLNQFKAYWVANTRGFQVEISTPLPKRGTRIGVAYIDVDTNQSVRNRWVGTMDPAAMQSQQVPESVASLHYSANIATRRLYPWVTRGTRARLFDVQGRLLADVNSLYDKSKDEEEFHPASGGFFNAVLFRIFAYFVSTQDAPSTPIQLTDQLHLTQLTRSSFKHNDANTQRYISSDNDHVLGTLTAIGQSPRQGYLLYESNEDLATAYSGSRVARLFSLLALVSLLAGFILLLFASVLSIRIRNLSKLAQQAVSADGRVKGLAQSTARDEIGDLSRHLSSLLNRSAHYTHYLEALSSRLSHELRTPLSVVKTSIENLDRSVLDDQSNTLLDRAEGGADQLGTIIKALVESTRLEQTVQQAQLVTLDVSEWMLGSLQRYRQVYPDSQFELIDLKYAKTIFDGSMDIHSAEQRTLPSFVDSIEPLKPIYLYGAPELLQQALDKLVDNAIGFSNNGRVELMLLRESVAANTRITIAVLNQGEHISGVNQGQIFDPMFSGRERQAGQLHLGLGLYIVRMICEAHAGKPVLRNLPNGVLIGMQLPSTAKTK